jgi:hypothetical protein
MSDYPAIPDPDLRRKWIYVLATCCAPDDKVKAGEALAAMLPALNLLPSHKFCDASAIYVASKSKRVPNYAAICSHLEDWWQENRPKPSLATLPPPDEAPHAQREREEEQNRLTWEAPERVLASLRSVREMGENHRMYEPCGRLLGRAVWKYAPHNLHLIPPEWHPEDGQ